MEIVKDIDVLWDVVFVWIIIMDTWREMSLKYILGICMDNL